MFRSYLSPHSPIESYSMGSSPVYELEHDGYPDVESGYVSGSSSQADIPEIHFTKPHLAFLNRQLQKLEPQGTKSSIHMRTLLS